MRLRVERKEEGGVGGVLKGRKCGTLRACVGLCGPPTMQPLPPNVIMEEELWCPSTQSCVVSVVARIDQSKAPNNMSFGELK